VSPLQEEIRMPSESDRLNWLKTLHPTYFAMTMATGIIAIALDILGNPVFSDVLYWSTVASWCILAILYIWRTVRFPKAVWADLTNPRLTFNYFTFVAATDVLGLVLYIHDHVVSAIACWWIALIVWAVLLYCSFGVLMLFHHERNVNIVDGGWLICIVGTQSLVLLGLKIIPDIGDYDRWMMFALFMLWGLGLFLYAIFVTLFSYRIFFQEITPDDYTPQMWVIMGAAAICANASSGIEMSSPIIDAIYEVHAVIEAVAVITWTWATWWIPLLVVIGIWKHGVHKIPLRYDPRQWSIVFPLGMYTVATYQVSLAAEFDALHLISHVTVWIALLAWFLIVFALGRRMTGGLLQKNR